MLKESNRKPNKICVDKGSDFTIDQLSHGQKKMLSVVAERFIRTLNNEIYKYMTSILKIVYNEKLHDIVNKYNNTYHSTIKVNPADV